MEKWVEHHKPVVSHLRLKAPFVLSAHHQVMDRLYNPHLHDGKVPSGPLYPEESICPYACGNDTPFVEKKANSPCKSLHHYWVEIKRDDWPEGVYRLCATGVLLSDI